MKARIAAAAVAVLAALGLGAGAAHATEAPASTPESASTTAPVMQVVDSALHSIDLDQDSTPAPKSPVSDVLQFLQDGITLAGRDVLLGDLRKDDTPKPDPKEEGLIYDNPAPPFELPNLGQKPDEKGPAPIIFEWAGKAADGLLGLFSFIPFVQDFRDSPAWQSDYLRIGVGLTLITAPLALITVPVGVVAGLATSLVLATIAASPGLFLGFALGFPWGVLPGFLIGLIGGIFLLLSGFLMPFWLIGGIIMITLGAIVVAATIPTNLGLNIPAGWALIAAGLVAVTLGLMPLLPVLISLGIIGLGFTIFMIPILISLAITSPLWLPIFAVVFFGSALITVPVGFLLGLLAVAIFPIATYLVWLWRGPTRPVKGMSEPGKRDLDAEDKALQENGKAGSALERQKDLAKKAEKSKEEREAAADKLALMSLRDNVALKNPLNVIGDYMDWFWDSMQWYLGQLPFVGPSLQRGINGMRASKLWKSDFFRIGATISLFTVIVIPVAAVTASLGFSALAGIATAVIADLVLALPTLGLGLLFGGLLLVIGAIFVPVLFLAGLTAVIFGILFILSAAGLLTGAVGSFISGIFTVPVGFPATALSIIFGVFGALLILAGLLGMGIAIIPLVWIPFFALFATVAVLLVVLLYAIGMVLAAPVAIGLGLAVAAVAAIVLTPIAPVVSIPVGLAVLGIALIFGLVLPTRPKGEKAPRVTKEDDPAYLDKDERPAPSDTKDDDNIPGVDLWKEENTKANDTKNTKAKKNTKKASTKKLPGAGLGTQSDYGLAG